MEVDLPLRSGRRDRSLPLWITQLARKKICYFVPLLHQAGKVEVSVLLYAGANPPEFLREFPFVLAVKGDPDASHYPQGHASSLRILDDVHGLIEENLRRKYSVPLRGEDSLRRFKGQFRLKQQRRRMIKRNPKRSRWKKKRISESRIY